MLFNPKGQVERIMENEKKSVVLTIYIYIYTDYIYFHFYFVVDTVCFFLFLSVFYLLL